MNNDFASDEYMDRLSAFVKTISESEGVLTETTRGKILELLDFELGLGIHVRRLRGATYLTNATLTSVNYLIDTVLEGWNRSPCAEVPRGVAPEPDVAAGNPLICEDRPFEKEWTSFDDYGGEGFTTSIQNTEDVSFPIRLEICADVEVERLTMVFKGKVLNMGVDECDDLALRLAEFVHSRGGRCKTE